MDAQFWDDRYRSREMAFSGNPNGVLVTEAAGLPPGRALDVGCGEGGDTSWLARRGWQVTATDISRVALDRAAACYPDIADVVRWTCADLTVTAPTAGAFDLVSLQYFPLLRQLGHHALRGLLAAVAPGGTLLIVSHDLADLPQELDHGVTATDYYQPSEVARFLDDGWAIIANETRPRTDAAPAGTHHTHDTVLRAQRS